MCNMPRANYNIIIDRSRGVLPDGNRDQRDDVGLLIELVVGIGRMARDLQLAMGTMSMVCAACSKREIPNRVTTHMFEHHEN